MGIFIAWQYYLELHIPPTPTPSSPPSVSPSPTPPKKWIPPPPLMRLSIWSRAQYRFSIVLIIAFLCWSAFLSWSFWVQLYYQDYVGLSPILTVVRLLPMFVTGVICNIVIAVVIGRVPVVYIVGTSPPPLSPSLLHTHSTHTAFSSNGNNANRNSIPPLRPDLPFEPLLVLRFPSLHRRRLWRRFRIRQWDSICSQGRFTSRTKRRGRFVPNYDSGY